jgi:aspartate/tyrosine/aromatic aminotransferase
MFESLTAAPPDAILGLTAAFQRDDNPLKVNLGVGVYKDERGRTPVLESVKAAEARILASADSKSYMPIGGSNEFERLTQELLFGADSPVIADKRVRTAQTPGGTGGLRVGADFLRKVRPGARVWVSRPTWANHKGIFASAGFPVEEYAYYNPSTRELDANAMMADLEKVPAGDVVLLHVCCHNPTGADLSLDQWRQVAGLAKAKGWLPFLDFAYQGFGDGVEADRAGLLSVAESCPELLIASSFSKNMGLYQDRTGAFSVVAGNEQQANFAYSHVEICIRVNYSNPPAHGGLIVTTIMGDDLLKAQWMIELEAMHQRIAGVRAELVEGLKQAGIKTDFSFIARQRGMFSFSGLDDEQVDYLRVKKSIYMVKGGRINVAGITPRNIDYLCASIKEVIG